MNVNYFQNPRLHCAKLMRISCLFISCEGRYDSLFFIIATQLMPRGTFSSVTPMAGVLATMGGSWWRISIPSADVPSGTQSLESPILFTQRTQLRSTGHLVSELCMQVINPCLFLSSIKLARILKMSYLELHKHIHVIDIHARINKFWVISNKYLHFLFQETDKLQIVWLFPWWVRKKKRMTIRKYQ